MPFIWKVKLSELGEINAPSVLKESKTSNNLDILSTKQWEWGIAALCRFITFYACSVKVLCTLGDLLSCHWNCSLFPIFNAAQETSRSFPRWCYSYKIACALLPGDSQTWYLQPVHRLLFTLPTLCDCVIGSSCCLRGFIRVLLCASRGERFFSRAVPCSFAIQFFPRGLERSCWVAVLVSQIVWLLCVLGREIFGLFKMYLVVTCSFIFKSVFYQDTGQTSCPSFLCQTELSHFHPDGWIFQCWLLRMALIGFKTSRSAWSLEVFLAGSAGEHCLQRGSWFT